MKPVLQLFLFDTAYEFDAIDSLSFDKMKNEK